MAESQGSEARSLRGSEPVCTVSTQATGRSQDTKNDTADWGAIREAYEGDALTVVQITSVFAVSTAALYARAKRDGWKQRRLRRARGRAVAGVNDAAGQGDAPRVPRSLKGRAAWRGQMIVRLYEAMDRQLSEIEASQVDHASKSATDRERQARQMNVMMRSMEKLSEFEEHEARRTAEAKRSKTKADAAAAPRDPESWREEIARRITRIRNAWGADTPTE
ncbi:MAG: hypothetical protein AAFZ01_05975 [Pseudomonadota bacterium]